MVLAFRSNDTGVCRRQHPIVSLALRSVDLTTLLAPERTESCTYMGVQHVDGRDAAQILGQAKPVTAP